MTSNDTIKRYKTSCIAKKYEQWKGIDNAKTFSAIAKSCIIEILFALAVYHN